MKKNISILVLAIFINSLFFGVIFYKTKKPAPKNTASVSQYKTNLVYKKNTSTPITKKTYKKQKKEKKSTQSKFNKKKAISKTENIPHKAPRHTKETTKAKDEASKRNNTSDKKVITSDHNTPIYNILDLDKQPEITSSIKPNYPEYAKEQGIEALVILKLTIDFDGSVKDVEVLDTIKGYDFETEAIQAVKQWQFSPCTLKGSPVRYSILQPIKFVLN